MSYFYEAEFEFWASFWPVGQFSLYEFIVILVAILSKFRLGYR